MQRLSRLQKTFRITAVAYKISSTVRIFIVQIKKFCQLGSIFCWNTKKYFLLDDKRGVRSQQREKPKCKLDECSKI